MTAHIRKRPSRSRGNQFYLDRSPDDQAHTLCGASSTTSDMSWAETQWAKYLAHVDCAECKAVRVEQQPAVSR